MTGAQIADRVRDLSRQGASAEALALCLSGQDGFPANETLWQLRLNLLRRLGRLEEARDVATDTSAESTRARAKPFFQRLAFETFLDLGDLAGARRRLEEFAVVDPAKGAAYLMCRARLALADPSDQRGLDDILPRLDAFPDHSGLNRAAADLLMRADRGADATDLLARVWQTTGQVEVLAHRARLVATLEGAGAASSLLESEAQSLPDLPWLWRLRLSLLEQAGAVSAAADLADTAARALPNDPDLRRQCWGLQAAAGRSGGVLEQAEALARDGRADMTLRLAAAETCLFFAPDQSGVELAVALADAAPDNLSAVRLAAFAALEKARDAGGALDLIARAEAQLSSAPQSGDARALVPLRARALNLFGFPGRAIEMLQPWQDRGELNWRGVAVLASCLIRMGRFEQAEGMLTAPQDTVAVEFARLRAESALGRGDLRTARDCLAGFAQGCAPRLDILRSLLRLQILAGDYAAAWSTYQKDMEIRAGRSGGNRKPGRPRRSLLGQILNEIRLKYGDRDRAGLRWDNEGMEASLSLWREDLDEDPGNTAAAFGLLSALFRTGGLSAPASLGEAGPSIPRSIGQFWDDPQPPAQVVDLIEWNRSMNPDYDHRCFDNTGALEYLLERGENQAVHACMMSSHVAARSDVFRLAWLWHEGGVWLDADDRCTAPLGTLIDHGRRFVGYQEIYGTVGNNFMAVRPQDPIIRAALDDAVGSILETAGAPIWLSSGPGAITRALALHGTQADGTLAAGITLMPAHQLLRAVSPHVRLNYKGTASHWVRQMQAPSR